MLRRLAIIILPMGLLIVMLLLLAACSGGSSEGRVLHMKGFDVTELAYRDHTRLNISFLVCTALKGLSPAEVVRLVDAAGAKTDNENNIPKAAILKPDQVGIQQDRERAATILLQECQRIQ